MVLGRMSDWNGPRFSGRQVVLTLVARLFAKVPTNAGSQGICETRGTEARHHHYVPRYCLYTREIKRQLSF